MRTVPERLAPLCRPIYIHTIFATAGLCTCTSMEWIWRWSPNGWVTQILKPELSSIQVSTISRVRTAEKGNRFAQNLSRLFMIGSCAEFLWNNASRYERNPWIYGPSRLLHSIMPATPNQGKVQSAFLEVNTVQRNILLRCLHISVSQNL